MARKNKPDKKTKAQQAHLAQLRDNPPFALVEAFRNLSTNIGFAIPKQEGRGRVICISSSIPNEGKTTVAVNLAKSCADAGEQTVLLDCDMRKPAVRLYYDCEGKKGIAEYLSGQAALDEVLVHSKVKHLDLVCGTKSVPNPLLLIKNERFDLLIEALARQYSYVILDTPPLGVVADALEISKNTDGILMVTRQGVSEYPTIRNTISDVDFANVNLLGFVLNGYKAAKSGKGYYGKYKYNYNYKNHY